MKLSDRQREVLNLMAQEETQGRPFHHHLNVMKPLLRLGLVMEHCHVYTLTEAGKAIATSSKEAGV